MQPEDMILPWQAFTRDFWSVDLPFSMEIKGIISSHKNKSIDFRPYMIKSPFTVFTTDNLPKVLDIFRKMHCRTLPVIHPRDGSLQGVITRQDIFRFMDL